jgi:hypothetical protein
MDLAAHLPRLWVHEKVTHRDRKALLRAAIDEVHAACSVTIKTPKMHRTFTARHVGDLRRSYHIPRCAEPASDASPRTYTVDQTAQLLKVSPPTVYLWLKLGVLVGEQVAAQAPWEVQLTAADRERLTPEPPPGWLTLAEAARELAITKQTHLNWVKARKINYVYVVRGRRSGLRFDVNSAPQRKQQRLLE